VISPADYSWKELLPYAGGALAVIAALAVVAWKLMRRKEDRHIQVVTCETCGWRGQVSRYAGRCPGCSNPLGEQKAKRG
jgi:predicted Zn-ribbon and HTH transcriptional regulator